MADKVAFALTPELAVRSPQTTPKQKRHDRGNGTGDTPRRIQAMIALDTNVVVRFLVKDDRRQALRARSVVSAAVAKSGQLYVSDIVVCEVVWLLEAAYGFGRGEIAAVLNRLLNARHLSFRSAERVARALEAYDTGKGDFADYRIRADALDFGCEAVVTFDKALNLDAHFRAP